MTVVTRTNLATDPRGLGGTAWVYGYGSGGTATPSSQTTGGPTSPSVPTFQRLTWGNGTTSPSGYIGCNTPGLVAGTVYTGAIYARASKAQTVFCQVDWYNGTTLVSTAKSGNTALIPNTWTQISDPGLTAPAGATNATMTVQTASSGSNWATGDTLDATGQLFEPATTTGTYFDGSTVNANSVMYAWAGAVNASPSTAKTYTPVIALNPRTDSPCPRVEVTISDVTPTDNVVTVWRTVDGKRQAVRGARRWTVNGSNAIIDYEAPLGRSVAYDLEVTSGLNYGAGVTRQSVTVNATSGFIQDPLVPSSAIPLYENLSPNGEPMLQGQAISALEYAAGMNLMQVLGSPDPVALMGQRMAAANIDFSMVTTAAQQATNLRNLLKQAPLLLVRPLPTFGSTLPGLCYVASAKPIEQPQFNRWDGTVTKWQLSGDLVAAPTMNVLVPVWTYGAVAALWTSYQQAQTALAAKTYLDVLKSPSGT